VSYPKIISGQQNRYEESRRSGIILLDITVIDLKGTLVDGSYHDLDSSNGIQIAGSMKDTVMKAQPVLLEPMMKVEVEVSENFLGDGG